MPQCLTRGRRGSGQTSHRQQDALVQTLDVSKLETRGRPPGNVYVTPPPPPQPLGQGIRVGSA